MQADPDSVPSNRLKIGWLRVFISGLIDERNDLLRTLVVLINDRLLPGNEIESGGMCTCVKDPAKKGTRGREDWRGWNEKARRRRRRSKYSREALHSRDPTHIPFHFFHFRVLASGEIPPLQRRKHFIPLCHFCLFFQQFYLFFIRLLDN